MGLFGKKKESANVSSPPSSQDDGKEEAVPLNEFVVVPGQPFPETPGEREKYLVTFAEDDPERPLNWPMWRRVLAKGIASICITFVSWGSSVIAPGITQIKETFHIGTVTAILCISLYVVGFATGPMVWGPGSELYGRKPMLTIGMAGFTMFAFACATAKDFQTLVICRFFMGAFGTTTLVVGPSISADLFTVTQRGKAVSAVIFCLVCGPMVAPVVGAFISNSFLRWRWTQYITGIMGALGICLMVFVFEETYPQLVLKTKASRIRKATGNWAVSAPIESMELDTQEILHRTVLKPFRMMMVEPILLLISIYQGFVYAILYLCLEALPYIFETHYHWKKSIPYLPYLGMLTGSIIVIMINLIFFDPITASLIEKSGMEIYPESRLPLMMMCGIIFPIGIFLMCWSGAYHVHWIVPTIGAALLGYGLIGIFLSCLTYIIDCYLLVAASAIAANTFIRSSMAGAFPLFALAMFKNLGTQWAGTLLGCLAVVLAPAPYVFFFYGPAIRKRSQYAKGEDSLDREDLSLQVTADPATRRSMPDYEW